MNQEQPELSTKNRATSESLTLFEHILLFLKVGSSDDPLGYSVYCEKEVTSG
jgi:hypothetical protein